PDRVMSASEVRAIPGRADFERSQQLIRQAQTSRSFEGQAGFIITGATIRSAVASSKVQVKIDNAGARSSEPAIVSVGIEQGDFGSVALQFDDGTGTVLAA